MWTVKRLVATVLEIAAEVILWGLLMGVLIANGVDPFLYGVLGSILALPVVLFLHGYYFTRILAGVVGRNGRIWFYPAIAAILFLIHMYVVFARLKPDMSSLGKATQAPFLVGGAGIVFACAHCGNWLLRRWTRTKSNPQGARAPDQSRLA